jgi:hypothetical protein
LPTGSTFKSVTSEQVLPEWYTNYAMQLLANQQALAAQPLQLYQGPRVAEFSPTQQQAFAQTGQAAGAYQPALDAATQATQGAMAAPGALATAQPFIGQATALNPSAVAASDFGAARNLTGQAAGVDITGAAQPYLTQAGQTSVANINQYMNPYTEQVVNRIGELGARNLRENIMPDIEGRYIAAGQLGFGGRQPGSAAPSGMLTDTARAIRDTSADILGKQTEALRAGYGEALGASSTDLSRMGTLASTAGNLSEAQQRGALGAAQQLQSLGTAGAGLTQEQQRLLAQVGQTAGGFAGQDITRNLTGAQQLAGLGETAQTLGLRGAGALGEVGAAQQSQAQKNLDIAYGDFLRQQGYPQEQINSMLQTFGGVKAGVPGASKEEGIVPMGYQPDLRPSTAETIGGALTGLGGILATANAGSALSKLLGI